MFLIHVRFLVAAVCAIELLTIALAPSTRVAAATNPLDAIGGRLAYIDTSGNLVVQDLAAGKKTQVAAAGANRLSDPAWSPDGTLIAFAAWPPPPPGFAQHSGDVYIVPADGSGPAWRVTPNSDNVGQISWLPNSQVLVFGFGYQVDHNVMRVNADGSFFQALYDGAGGMVTYNDPSVSPDGQFVATLQTQTPGGGVSQKALVVSAPDGSGLTDIADNVGPLGYAAVPWLPDGSGVLYPDGNRLMEATVGGSPPTVFLRANGNVSYDPEPAVAPDGSAIAYVYDGGQVLGTNGPTTEYRVAVHPLPDTGGHFYRVDGGYVGKLQWVGGAQALLFDVESAGQTELYLSDVDGHTTTTGMRLGAGFDWHS